MRLTTTLCLSALLAFSVHAAPQRVVSLLPSLTESVCALGACERLVGVDRYSNWPASVRQLPIMGGGLDPNVEAIVAVRPDLVLIAKSARVLPRLRELGLRVEVLEPQSHAQMQLALTRLGSLLELPSERVEQAQRNAQLQLEEARSSLPQAAHGLRIYFEASDGPYAAGPDSFIGETMAQLGLMNVVDASQGIFPLVSSEWVVAQQPDVILISAMGAAQLSQRPGWSQLKALQTKRVCAFSPEQADVLVRAGPRWGEAAQLIAQCIRRTLSDR